MGATFFFFFLSTKDKRDIIIRQLPPAVLKNMNSDTSQFLNVHQEIAGGPYIVTTPVITMKQQMIHFKKVSPSTPPVIIGKVSSASVASQKIHKNLCQNFNKSKSFHQKLYCLEDNVNVSSLFQPSKYGWCYLAGSRSAVNPFEECKCRKGWHGQYCSTPDVVERSDYPNEYGTSIRAEPRRIIYAFPFTFEFEMLEARMAELGDVVDVFVILESNYTASGKTKPRYLLQNLQQEYLSQYQHKILLLQMDSFPREGKRNGWVVDEKIRQYLGREIFERIPNLRPDDMIVIQDADELPVKETIFFLKFHN
ncbi:hypothetical protein CAPTEDRAFT_194340, partial [Capitella teleta]